MRDLRHTRFYYVRALLLSMPVGRSNAKSNIMDILKKNATQLVQSFASNSDIEDGVITAYEVKRNLGRRHINMIAIAGMVVGQKFLKPISRLLELTHTNYRVQDFSWPPARQSLQRDQSALSLGIYSWI